MHPSEVPVFYIHVPAYLHHLTRRIFVLFHIHSKHRDVRLEFLVLRDGDFGSRK